jgi:hypothetical protein
MVCSIWGGVILVLIGCTLPVDQRSLFPERDHFDPEGLPIREASEMLDELKLEHCVASLRLE